MKPEDLVNVINRPLRAQRYAARIINGQYKTIKFEELQAGDRFRLFESNGDPVMDHEGNVDFAAESDPYWDPDASGWAIKILTAARDRK
jgi:hypothetical protein